MKNKMIESKDNPKIKELKKLYESKKERDLKGLFLVEGYNLCAEAKSLSLLSDVYSIKAEKDYPESIIISEKILKSVTDTISPEGIVGVCKKVKKDSLGSKVLFLDRVQDPGNIGTLLRSAIAFGFDTICLFECCDIYNPKVIRSSQGAIFKINIFDNCKFDDIPSDYRKISTNMNGIDPKDISLSKDEKICLILGNEGQGVSKEIQEKSDINLTIPMINTESLNVGVAGSILMYLLKDI